MILVDPRPCELRNYAAPSMTCARDVIKVQRLTNPPPSSPFPPRCVCINLFSIIRFHDISFRYVFNAFGILAMCGLRPMILFWYILDMLLVFVGHSSWAGSSAMMCFLYVFDMFLLLSESRLDYIINWWYVFNKLLILLWIPFLPHEKCFICFGYVFDTLWTLFLGEVLSHDMFSICFRHVFETLWNPTRLHDNMYIYTYIYIYHIIIFSHIHILCILKLN